MRIFAYTSFVIHGLIFSFFCLRDSYFKGACLSITFCIKEVKASKFLSKFASVNSFTFDKKIVMALLSSSQYNSASKLDLSLMT